MKWNGRTNRLEWDGSGVGSGVGRLDMIGINQTNPTKQLPTNEPASDQPASHQSACKLLLKIGCLSHLRLASKSHRQDAMESSVAGGSGQDRGCPRSSGTGSGARSGGQRSSSRAATAIGSRSSSVSSVSSSSAESSFDLAEDQGLGQGLLGVDDLPADGGGDGTLGGLWWAGYASPRCSGEWYV